MKAVIVSNPGGPAITVNDRPKPRLRETYMRVRPMAVALNPADVAIADFMGSEGTLIGCDYAGIIEEVGAGVHRDFKMGDRVCGGQRAGDPLEKENGCFAEEIMVKADMALHIPSHMSFEEASTLGVCQLTTGRCLYQKFGIPWPKLEGPHGGRDAGQVFIYGGSSAMGTMLIQFAKLSNFEVVTTASPSNFEMCRSFGADHIFDYRDPKAPEQIKELTKGALKIVVDCISTEETAAFCAKVIAAGGKYSAILPTACPRDDVESVTTLGYSFTGEEWEQLGVTHPPSQEDFEYSKGFAELSEKLLAEGKVRAHPVDLREGGLEGIPAALDDLRAKRVSGKKIVFKV
ncbi:Trans-enoyl reductase ACTTS2 [Pseudocercospora fuligena]|uniref:Trans-enoyl reductase ACTTS2 n=1 Tax=Pseudocercospora fuligena TaxID=685502 RepID=A0A8H6VBW6_9PEZI|nr:Trans-enoyl reductase ACTTS2 [Pseudocercospora fuligena]